MTTSRSNISTTFRSVKQYTALQLDLLEYILSKINPTNKDFDTVSFDVKDFFKETQKKIHDYESIRDALRKIRKREIIIDGLTYTSWFSSISVEENESYFTVNIDPKIKEHLLDLQGNYIKYQTSLIFKFKSSYTKKFYPYLKALAEKGYKKIKLTIPEIKDFFGISDKYKNYADLKRYVIEVIERELKEKSDVFFTYEAKKKNRTYYNLFFKIHKQPLNKKQLDMSLDPENPVVDYMQKKYGFNERTMSNILNLAKDDQDTNLNFKAADIYMKSKERTGIKISNKTRLVKRFVENDWVPSEKPKPKNKKKELDFPDKEPIVEITQSEIEKQYDKDIETLKSNNNLSKEFIEFMQEMALNTMNKGEIVKLDAIINMIKIITLKGAIESQPMVFKKYIKLFFHNK